MQGAVRKAKSHVPAAVEAGWSPKRGAHLGRPGNPGLAAASRVAVTGRTHIQHVYIVSKEGGDRSTSVPQHI